MKSKNQKKRDIFRNLVIMLLTVLGLEVIFKLCGYGISDWLFIIDSVLLVVCCVLFMNFNQGVKEDEKYGSQ